MAINLSSKSRYALKIMMDLALHEEQDRVQRLDIAARQGIPRDYLDQIMMRLRNAELVRSIRGRGGGYRLHKPASQINIWQIFEAAEGHLEPVACLAADNACGFDVACVAKDAWTRIFDAIRTPLETIDLRSLVEQGFAEHQLCPIGGIRECRGVDERLRNQIAMPNHANLEQGN